MTTTRLVMTLLGRGMALTLTAGLAVLGVIEAVERSRGRSAESLGLWVVLRLPALARELWPALLAAGAALAIARARARGELVALGAAGVSPAALQGRIIAVAVASGLGVAGITEGLTPLARDAALAVEAAAEGRSVEVSGGWVHAERSLVYVSRVGPDALWGVTILPHAGAVARIDAEVVMDAGAGWRARGAVARRLDGGGVRLEPLDDAALTAILPSPEAMRLGTRRLRLEEASLGELRAHPDPDARAWARHRGLAPLGGAIGVASAALFALGARWGAASVSAAALIVGALWATAGLGAVSLGGSGLVPLALAVVALGLSLTRRPRWGA